MHYSVSREDYITGHRTDVRPDFQNLLTQGYKKAKLRRIVITWNTAPNEWAGTFRKDFDIMVEAKCKNLASIHLRRKHDDHYLMVALMTVINVEEQRFDKSLYVFQQPIFMTCKNVSNMLTMI